MCTRWLPFNPLVYCLQQSSSRLVILDAERADVVSPAVAKLRKSGVAGFLVWGSAVLHPRWEGLRLWEDVKRLREDQLGILNPPQTDDELDIAPEDDATIFFTSGTYVLQPLIIYCPAEA